MANLPYLDEVALSAILLNGGYSQHIRMSQRTNLLLLSALYVIQQRWMWQTPLEPITDAQWQQIQQYISDAEEQLMSNFSVGVVFASVSDVQSEDTLPLLGQSVLQADYPELAVVVPSSWLFGLDIVLPDMRERGVFGSDDFDVVGTAVGENDVTLTESQIPSHNHTQNAHSHSYIQGVGATALGGEIPATASFVTPTPSTTGLTTATNNPTGGGNSHNNIQRSLTVGWFIIAR